MMDDVEAIGRNKTRIYRLRKEFFNINGSSPDTSRRGRYSVLGQNLYDRRTGDTVWKIYELGVRADLLCA